MAPHQIQGIKDIFKLKAMEEVERLILYKSRTLTSYWRRFNFQDRRCDGLNLKTIRVYERLVAMLSDLQLPQASTDTTV